MSDKILKLDQAQTLYQDLRGRIDALPTSGDIPEVPVQDVQVNGASIVQDGIANVPVASASSLGVVKVLDGPASGIMIDSNNSLKIYRANSQVVKTGTNSWGVLVPAAQHMSTFYGLAKAAGDTTQSQSANAVGTYTTEAKAAIQTMLGVPSTSDMADYATKADTVLNTTLSLGRLANSEVGENSVALGDNVTASGPYSFAIGSETVASSDSAYAEGEGTQATDSAAHAEGTYTQATGYASHAEGDNTIAEGYFSHAEGTETTATGMATHVFGERNFNCNESVETNERGTMVEIVGNGQDDTYSNARALTWTGDEYLAGNLYVNANSTSTSGTRVATVTEIPEVPVQDIQINGVSVLQDGVANVPMASNSTIGVVQLSNLYGIRLLNGRLATKLAGTDTLKRGSDQYDPVVAQNQHESIFYGLSKIAGIDLKDETVTLGTYPEASKTAIKEMLGVQDGLKVVRLI